MSNLSNSDWMLVQIALEAVTASCLVFIVLAFVLNKMTGKNSEGEQKSSDNSNG